MNRRSPFSTRPGHHHTDRTEVVPTQEEAR